MLKSKNGYFVENGFIKSACFLVNEKNQVLDSDGVRVLKKDNNVFSLEEDGTEKELCASFENGHVLIPVRFLNN